MGKTIGLLPAHPSQIWILRAIAAALKDSYSFRWYIRDKDISCTLADELGIEYEIISKAQKGLLGNFQEFTRNIFRVLSVTREAGIDLWISKYSAVHIAAKLLGRKSIFFVDDDYHIVPFLYNLSCPWADVVVLPETTSSGRFKKNLTRFVGVFELVYLHPDRFSPDMVIFDYLGIQRGNRYCIIRLAALSAHHDVGAKGLTHSMVERAIALAENYNVRVFITSENPIHGDLENYRLAIPLSLIHHALFFADFIVGDSQTMTSEAAVLGTPAFRINSFVGRIGCLADLEQRAPSYGYKPGMESQLLMDMEKHLQTHDKNPKNTIVNTISGYEDPLRVLIDAVHELME